MKKRWLALVTFLVIFVGTGLTERAGWWAGSDRAMHDLFHILVGSRGTPQHAALVFIDDATLARHSDDPLVFWGPHFATALRVLREVGVAAVGVDMIFSVSAEAWLKNHGAVGEATDHDLPLRQELMEGKTVLAASLAQDQESGEQRLMLPIPEFMYALPGFGARIPDHVGLINLFQDPDGAVRGWMPALHGQREMPHQTFALLLALKKMGLDPAAEGWQLGGKEISLAPEVRSIGYLGPPGTFRPLSMARLLEPEALKDEGVQALRGKVVILSDGHSGSQDLHQTPYSWRGLFIGGGSLMHGAEIHAHIVETLLSGRHPRAMPPWMMWSLLAWPLALGTWWFYRFPPLYGLAGWGGLALLDLAVGYGLFVQDWLLPVSSHQVGVLACFMVSLGSRLTREERDRRQMHAIFERYLSPSVMDQMLASGTVPSLGGENKEVTVLFSDIRNFTTLSERLSAQQVVALLNAYFERVCQPILERGGIVDKFIGDAVMAIFGAPLSDPAHARHAIQAALEMEVIAREFQTWVDTHYGGMGLPPFQIGVGLHSGTVVMGNIGSSRHMDFTAIGDTVNVASRLEGLTKELKCVIVISEATLTMAGAGVVVGRGAELPVKGRAEPVRVHELLGCREEAGKS